MESTTGETFRDAIGGHYSPIPRLPDLLGRAPGMPLRAWLCLNPAPFWGPGLSFPFTQGHAGRCQDHHPLIAEGSRSYSAGSVEVGRVERPWVARVLRADRSSPSRRGSLLVHCSRGTGEAKRRDFRLAARCRPERSSIGARFDARSGELGGDGAILHSSRGFGSRNRPL